jgi:hypothetical protein
MSRTVKRSRARRITFLVLSRAQPRCASLATKSGRKTWPGAQLLTPSSETRTQSYRALFDRCKWHIDATSSDSDLVGFEPSMKAFQWTCPSRQPSPNPLLYVMEKSPHLRCICCPSAFWKGNPGPTLAMRLLRSTASLLAISLARMHPTHCPAHLHLPCATPRPAPPLLRESARMDRTCAAPD